MKKFLLIFLITVCASFTLLGFAGCSDLFGHGHTHNYSEQVVNPTCEVEGYTVYTCSCSDSYTGNFLPAKGHQRQGIGETIEATCTHVGGVQYQCSACGNLFIDPLTEIEKLPHAEIIDLGYPATCTSVGLTDGIHCGVCASIIVAQTSIPKSEHIRRVEIEGYAETCTKDGLTDKIICIVCNSVLQEQRTIYTTGHMDSDSDDFCDKCNELLADNFIQIKSAQDLMNIGYNLKGNYLLCANISLKGVNWTPLGTESDPFIGKLYGNGYTISDISFSNMSQGALFRYNGGTIRGIKLNSVSLSLDNYSGSLGGFAVYNRGVIKDCEITELKVSNKINQSKSTGYPNYDGGTVSFSSCFGGFAAVNEGIIEGCILNGYYSANFSNSSTFTLTPNPLFFVDADYKFTCNSNFYFGGIAGQNKGTIRTCGVNQTNTVTISVSATTVKKGRAYANSTAYIGVIAGQNTSSIAQCVAQKPTISQSKGSYCTINLNENVTVG